MSWRKGVCSSAWFDGLIGRKYERLNIGGVGWLRFRMAVKKWVFLLIPNNVAVEIYPRQYYCAKS